MEHELVVAIKELTLQLKMANIYKLPYETWTDEDKVLMRINPERIQNERNCKLGLHNWAKGYSHCATCLTQKDKVNGA